MQVHGAGGGPHRVRRRRRHALVPAPPTRALRAPARQAARSQAAITVPPELKPLALGDRVNHGHNQVGKPLVGFAPTSAAEALRQINWAASNGLPVSAEGSLHSWSAGAMVNGGVSLVPWGMRSEDPLKNGNIVPLESERGLLRDGEASGAAGQFWVSSGTQLRQLNPILWAQGYSLPVMGGYDAQTVGGALPTGTHGSVLKYGPMAEMAQGFELVRNGTKTRLEPSGGPTDPAKFRRQHPDWTLIQDDDEFHAVQLGMGTTGFVTRVLLQAVPRFYLQERRITMTATQVHELLKDGGVYKLVEHARSTAAMFPGQRKPAYSIELALDPHSDEYLVTFRDKVAPDRAAKLDELAKTKPGYFENPWTKNVVDAFSRPADLTRPPLAGLVPGYFHNLIGKLFEFTSEHLPMAVPLLLGTIGAGARDAEYTNRSYNVFHVGEGPSSIPTEVGTLSVPLRGDMYIEAVQIMKQVIKQLDAAKGWKFPGILSLRFVKGTDILLADNEDVCKFEVILSGKSEFIQRQAQAYMDAFFAALDKRFPGLVRAHFGHMVPEQLKGAKAIDKLRELFPADPGTTESRYDRFLDAREELDPQGTFVTEGKQELLPGIQGAIDALLGAAA